jgi:hypothetical protein
MPRKKEVKWFSSKAKSMLRDDILAGNVDDKMCPKLVYQSRAEFQKFPFDRFKPNLKSLLDKIKEERKRMGEDAKAYGHDMALLVKKLKEDQADNPTAVVVTMPWHMSEAKRLLQQDIADGRHTTMKPKDLYNSRDEYKVYALKTFRDHIYQMQNDERKHIMRSAKKKARAAAILALER